MERWETHPPKTKKGTKKKRKKKKKKKKKKKRKFELYKNLISEIDKIILVLLLGKGGTRKKEEEDLKKEKGGFKENLKDLKNCQSGGRNEGRGTL